MAEGYVGRALERVEDAALLTGRGLWIPPRGRYRLECDRGARLRIDMVALPSPSRATSRNARARAIGANKPLSRDLRDCPAETTGDRRFRVLFGPGRDCAAATQFVGEIPPGRAAEHSHPYDEVVLVLRGTGVAHAGSRDYELSAGTCLHLPPGMRHCLENTGPQAMRVLGVFHPADSPSVKLPRSPAGPS